MWPCRWSTAASGSSWAAAIALAVASPTRSAADQARALRHRHELDVGQADLGLVQRVLDDGADQLQMVAAGDLGHDPAVAVVDALRGDDVGADLPSGGHDSRAGVVAGGLEGEDHPAAPDGEVVFRVRHMITASSPLSR